MLEVLCKPTLTLFVKKPFLFWRKKKFLERNLRMAGNDLKRSFRVLKFF